MTSKISKTPIKRMAYWLAATALFGSAATGAAAQETIFLSTQLRPVEEATKVRQIILRARRGL